MSEADSQRAPVSATSHHPQWPLLARGKMQADPMCSTYVIQRELTREKSESRWETVRVCAIIICSKVGSLSLCQLLLLVSVVCL